MSGDELFGIWKNFFPSFVVAGLARVLEQHEICYMSFGYAKIMRKLVRFFVKHNTLGVFNFFVLSATTSKKKPVFKLFSLFSSEGT